ncbi:MAG: rhombosortase [Opitutae bacterium]|nr:rhombosortase [Opitutae bacterium]
MKALRTTFLLFGLPAVLVWLVPATHPVLLYERVAILNGDWWRLWTGHWVHFSFSHLAWNLAVLLAAGTWLEHLQSGRLLRFTLLAASVLSLGLLAGEPAMQTYGGLSGLATGVVVLLALMQLDRRGADAAWWWAVLVLVAVKTGLDAIRPDALFAGFGAQTVRPSVLAHISGAGLAVAFFLSRQLRFCLPLSATLRPAPPSSQRAR